MARPIRLSCTVQQSVHEYSVTACLGCVIRKTAIPISQSTFHIRARYRTILVLADRNLLPVLVGNPELGYRLFPRLCHSHHSMSLAILECAFIHHSFLVCQLALSVRLKITCLSAIFGITDQKFGIRSIYFREIFREMP